MVQDGYSFGILKPAAKIHTKTLPWYVPNLKEKEHKDHTVASTEGICGTFT
jgi:hypothetical protein